MKHRLTFGAALAAALFCGVAYAGDLKSGPQVGENIPGAFHCMQVFNADKPEWAGTSQCLVCQNGGRAVAMIFARDVDAPLTALLKKLDAEVGKSNKKMGAFVVLLSKDETAEKKLSALAEKEKIKNVSLSTMDNQNGPPGYNVAKDADVTVVLYKAHKVAANHAFKKGEFTQTSVDKIVGDLPKITGQ